VDPPRVDQEQKSGSADRKRYHSVTVDLNLQGKIAVVTGASKGIGLAITKGLVAEGARVIAGARDVGGELGGLASRWTVRAVSIDLSSSDGPQTLVAHAEEFGGLDILVNNVGAVAVRLEGFSSVTDDQWLASLNLNFMAAVRTTRAALAPMLRRGAGTIVTVSSVNSFLPDPGVIDYCAAKAALASFSKALSKEVGPKGIRMNTVSPGPVETALWLGPQGVAATVAKASGVDAETARQQVVASQGGFATGRFTRPEEVADLVLFLASDRSGNVTGADFVIDGGLIKTL
jgi:NAD(P)-dependent dehydrogenase (short-subunit alcohol dehydrogenase family)